MFFHINDTGEISGAVLWEAFKAYIRGVLISVGAGVKKERAKKKENLMTEIYKLEQIHKAHKGIDRPLLHQLTIKREELKDLMENESNRIMNKHLRDKYRWGNKETLGKNPEEKKRRKFH